MPKSHPGYLVKCRSDSQAPYSMHFDVVFFTQARILHFINPPDHLLHVGFGPHFAKTYLNRCWSLAWALSSSPFTSLLKSPLAQFSATTWSLLSICSPIIAVELSRTTLSNYFHEKFPKTLETFKVEPLIFSKPSCPQTPCSHPWYH